MVDYGFFEFLDPYYALIKAKGYDEAIQEYENHVSVIEIVPYVSKNDQFRYRQHKIKNAHIKLLPFSDALACTHKATDFDSVEDTKNFMENTEGIMLIDAHLL